MESKYEFSAEYISIDKSTIHKGIIFTVTCDDFIEAWHTAVEKATGVSIADNYDLYKLSLINEVY